MGKTDNCETPRVLFDRHAVVLALDRIRMRGDETWYDYYHKALNAIAKLPPVELTPCDLCKYGHPSSGDSKPCSMCPAERREDD